MRFMSLLRPLAARRAVMLLIAGFGLTLPTFAQVIDVNPPTAPGIEAPANQNPRLSYAGTELALDDTARAPYRDIADGSLCVAPEALERLGIMYILDETAGKASFTVPETGMTATVDLRTPPREFGRKGRFVPAVETIEALGGKCQYDTKTATLYVRSVLTGVELLGGQLRFKATLPITVKVLKMNDGKLLAFDIPGADVGILAKTINVVGPNITASRAGQFQDDVARVVLEFSDAAAFAPLDEKPAVLLVLNPVASIPASAPIAQAPVTPPTTKPVIGLDPNKKPTRIRGVRLVSVNDGKAQIVVEAGSSPSVSTTMDQGHLTLDLNNVIVDDSADDTLDGAKHPFVQELHLTKGAGNSAQLVIDLTRAVIYSLRLDPKGGFTLDLSMPRGAGGKLAGKLVVVDAGHGDHDSGAKGVNGTYEKNVNLAIARKVAQALREMDVNVIMTRDSNSFVELGERAAIANRANADFFISVHSDSARGAANGSTTYYHMDNPDSRTLAGCIADRLKNMGGIRSQGPRSDHRIYQNGFAVLRLSTMPGVLCECGFMTNSSDVRLLNNEDQQTRIAKNIAFGLRDYVEGGYSFPTRVASSVAETLTTVPVATTTATVTPK